MQRRPSTQPQLSQEIEALCLKTLSLKVQSRDQDLFETGVLDSLSLVQLIFELERHFKIELPLAELDIASLRSIEEIAGLIERRQAAPPGPSSLVVDRIAS